MYIELLGIVRMFQINFIYVYVCMCVCVCVCTCLCYMLLYLFILHKCPHKDSKPEIFDIVGTGLCVCVCI